MTICFWGSMKGLCSTDMVDVRDTRFFGKYKILVAPKYCGYSVPQYVIDDLMKYVNSGGILISFDARFAVGKRDLTNPTDVSEQLYGFDFSNEETEVKELIFPGSPDAPTLKGKGKKQKKIRFLDKQNIEILASSVPNNEPVIVERKIGGGKVIYVNLDFAERVKTDRAWTKLLAFLASRSAKLVASISPGAMSIQSVIRKGERALFSLSAETNSSGAMSIQSVIRKGERALVNNAQDLLKIDTVGLGLKAETFQAMRLTGKRFD